jgi:hypothetical protein
LSDRVATGHGGFAQLAEAERRGGPGTIPGLAACARRER